MGFIQFISELAHSTSTLTAAPEEMLIHIHTNSKLATIIIRQFACLTYVCISICWVTTQCTSVFLFMSKFDLLLSASSLKFNPLSARGLP